MPVSFQRDKRRRASGWLTVLIIAVVVLGAGAAAFYLWSRSAVASTAETYINAAVAPYTSGRDESATLKRLTAREDIAAVPGSEAVEGARALRSLLGDLKIQAEVKRVAVGWREARADVHTTATFSSRSTANDVTLVLVREGLSWKVSLRKSSQVAALGMAPPTSR